MKNPTTTLNKKIEVFWDGYGLDQKHTGIHSYASSLSQALARSDVFPRIIGNSNCELNFPHLTTKPMRRVPSRKLAHSKIIWSILVANHLKHLLRSTDQYRDTIILHGLSNINLTRSLLTWNSQLSSAALVENQSNTPRVQGNHNSSYLLQEDNRDNRKSVKDSPPPTEISQHLVHRVKKIITVHDLIPLIAPESVSFLYRLQFRFMLPRVLASADRIIAVSQWTAREIKRRFPDMAHKITVIPNGFPAIKFSLPTGYDKTADSSTTTHRLSDNTSSTKSTAYNLLEISRFEPYKRFPILIQLLRDLPNSRLTLITNSRGVTWAEKNARDLIQSQRLVIRTGVTATQLDEIFQATSILVHPSMIEGFCLPAAEAISHGIPVVYQGGTALDETVGNTVGIQICEDSSALDWAEGVRKAAILAADQSNFLKACQKHISNQLSWNEVARRVLETYRNV